jgi:hypothetical protein
LIEKESTGGMEKIRIHIRRSIIRDRRARKAGESSEEEFRKKGRGE